MSRVSALALSTALVFWSGIASAGELRALPQPKPLSPSLSLADKMLKGMTYMTRNGTTISPTIVTPKNLEDHTHRLPVGPGVKIAF